MNNSILFRDTFNSGSHVSNRKWKLPSFLDSPDSTFLGRTQFRVGTFGNSIPQLPDTLPRIVNGKAQLRLDTLNPVLLDVPNNPLDFNSANPSFYGTDLIINKDFSLGSGLAFEAKVRVDAPRGLVASLFAFFDQGLGQGNPGTDIDEVDFEFLTNQKILTNVYDDDPLGPGNGIFLKKRNLDFTKFNTFRIEWRPNSLRWFINGTEVLTRTDIVPDEADSIRLNFWAPSGGNNGFSEAFSETLKPVSRRPGDTNASLLRRNRTFIYEVDSVQVERLARIPNPTATIIGSQGNDILFGNQGRNLIRGGAGADTLDGKGGIDTVDYATSNAGVTVDLGRNVTRGGHAQGDQITNFENISGSRFRDSLLGDAKRNELIGKAGKDRLVGNAGNDILQGDQGRDTLIGGGGRDRFRLLSDDHGADIITDFQSRSDLLEISATGFRGGFSAGTRLKPQQFVLGSKAMDRNDRFIYNQRSGNLLFDRDGVGGAGAVKIANFSNRVALSNADIMFIS